MTPEATAVRPALGRRMAAALALVAAHSPAPHASAQDAQRKQEIVFAELPKRTTADAPFSLVAKSTSGLKVIFAIADGPAVIEDGKLRLTGQPGLVVVRASQPGNSVFLAAAPVVRAFAVTPPPSRPVFTLQPRGVQSEAGQTIILSAEVKGEPHPSYQWRKDGKAILAAVDRTLTIVSAAPEDSGSYDLIASNDSGSATSTPALVWVGKRHQTLFFSSSITIFPGQPTMLSANSSSGLPVRFEIVSGSGTISGSVVTAPAGTISVRACQDGDATYEPAAPIIQNFTVGSPRTP